MKISVVIPTHDVERFIARTIESALAQTRAAHEVIVVDDCSTDGTREVVRRYPVTLIELGRNVGNAAARNRGIAAATGDTIAMLDGDDYWAPHHLETLAALLDRHPDAVLAASAVHVFGDRDHDLVPRMPAGPPSDVSRAAFDNCVVWHMAVLYRADAARRLGCYHEPDPVACDMDLWMRLSREGPFVCTHDVTAYYRVHGAQISAVPYRQKLACFRHRRRHVDRLDAAGETALAAELRGRMKELWLEQLREAWRTRDAAGVRALLGQRDVIAGVGAADVARWNAAALCVPLTRSTWDRLPLRARAAARRLVARGGARASGHPHHAR